MGSLYLPKLTRILAALGLLVALGACSSSAPQSESSARAVDDNDYVIGPGDTIDVFVWRAPELSVGGVPVRPDGKVSIPLVEDLPAAGKTSSALARDIEAVLSTYLKNPLVTVTVTGFVGEYQEQVRVIGEAAEPKALPYRTNMTVLDVMIAVGGLTEFAAGNKATLVRTVDGQQEQIPVKLADLLKDGDIDANIEVRPGDVLIIPESWF